MKSVSEAQVSAAFERVDYGERHALTFARQRGYAIATDDMEARRLAEYDIPRTGSLGIVVRGIERGPVALEESES